MDKVQHENDDTLFDSVMDVAAVTAMGTGAASYFFRHGNGPELNNALLRAKFEFGAMYSYLDDNISDVTQLSRKGFRDARRRGLDRYAAYESRSVAFDIMRQKEMQQFAEIFQTGGANILNKLYNSDLQNTVEGWMQSKQGLDNVTRRFIRNNIDSLIYSKQDISVMLQRMASELTEAETRAATPFISELYGVIQDKIDEIDRSNQQSPWNIAARERAGAYIRTLKDPVRMLEDQTEHLKGMPGKVLDPNITVAELSKLKADNIDEYRRVISIADKSPIFKHSKNGDIRLNLLEEIVDLYEGDTYRNEQHSALGKLQIEGIRRNSRNEIYTLADTADALRNARTEIGKVGSLFKINEIAENMERSVGRHTFKAGEYQPFLMAMLGRNGDRLERAVHVIGERVYEEDGKNGLVELTELRGKGAIWDSSNNIYKSAFNTAGMQGMQAREKEVTTLVGAVKNWLGGEVGFGYHSKQSTLAGDNIREYGIFSEISPEKIQRLATSYYDITDALATGNLDSDKLYKANETVTGISRYLKSVDNYTRGFDVSVAEHLANSDVFLRSPRASRYLDYIRMLSSNENSWADVIWDLSHATNGGKTLYNRDLAKTLSNFVKDQALERSKKLDLKDLFSTTNPNYVEKLTPIDALKKQLTQEFIYSAASERNLSPQDMFRIIDDVLPDSLSHKKDMAKDIVATTFLNRRLNTHANDSLQLTESSLNEASYKGKHLANERDLLGGYIELITSDSDSDKALKEQIENLSNRYAVRDVGLDRRGMDYSSMPRNIYGRKTYGPFSGLDTKSIIADINQGQYERAVNRVVKPLHEFALELGAGPGDLRHYTGLSNAIYIQTSRLNNLLNDVDKIVDFMPFDLKENLGLNVRLGLKPQDASTSWKILKNLTVKRMLPLAAAYQVFDFADDIVGGITGTSLKGLAANTASAGYLGVKWLTGIIGDDALKSFSKDNVLLRYWSGDDNGEWNTYEEEKKYQDTGYSRIRRARFWSFGSSNPFLGSGISYWEPSTKRLWNSNYRDESLYNGSFFTKWSPERLVNPYYLENLHSEDRPYPVSGSLFDDYTPWGILGNATIGEIIKPRIQLHSDRLIDGVDVKTIIAHQNNQIRQKEARNHFYVYQGRLRSMEFMSFGSAFDETQSKEDREFEEPTVHGQYSSPLDLGETLAPGGEIVFSDYDRLSVKAAKGNIFAKMLKPVSTPASRIIAQLNRDTMQRAMPQGYDKTQGFMIETKRKDFAARIEKMYENGDEISDLLNDTHSDYLKQMAVSERMLGGLYGYIGSALTGWGNTNQRHLATSQDMNSTSRWFWDSQIGGFGGNIMEVTRRFIPEYRRASTVNPLMNTMPDWLPERFRFGDPYTAVPEGEMRLPGRGYQSLNPLHPDDFGEYGAFDRFKILADIAPTSAEYKLWKRIASKTVQDPELKAEIQEIKERVKKQTKQHEFYDYKYVGRDVQSQDVYISEVLKNGQFKVVGSDETYKLSGITLKANENETTEQVLNRYIHAGMQVELVTDTNKYYARNNDKANSINASIKVNGEHINQQMLENGDAKKRASDNSVAFVHSNHGDLVNLLNYAAEAIGHADIPVLHSRWSKIDDPLESYKDDFIYGSAFQSWDAPIDTFIIPNMRKAASSTFWTGYGIAADIIKNNMDPNIKGPKELMNIYEQLFPVDNIYGTTLKHRRMSANAIKWSQRMALGDRGTLMGNAVTKVLHFTASGVAKEKEYYGKRFGNALTLAYSAIVAPENLAVQVMSWSRLGYLLDETFMGNRNKWKTAAVGAAIGVLRWAGTKKAFATDETAETYIPDKVRERWDMEDYFDRLNYLKYTALFEKAAKKAKEEEDVDIKAILLAQDKESHDIKKTKREIMDALDELKNENSQEAVEMRMELNEKLNSLKSTKTPILTGGEYTKSAIMYYNAAKATMFALDETSSMTDIIRALPVVDREYFMEFVKEKDPERRAEIMKIASPQIRKALKLLWGSGEEKSGLSAGLKKFLAKSDKPISNEEYFATHALPPPTWKGWDPAIDLADVKAKVIRNEGAMVESEFGIYASQYRDPKVINAPNINYNDGGNGLLLSSLGVKSILEGYGLVGVEVSVEPSQDSTLTVIANIVKTAPYKISQGDLANALSY